MDRRDFLKITAAGCASAALPAFAVTANRRTFSPPSPRRVCAVLHGFTPGATVYWGAEAEAAKALIADILDHGHGFAGVVPRFDRFLRCTRCGREAKLPLAGEISATFAVTAAVVGFRHFAWINCRPHGTCPSCGQVTGRLALDMVDRVAALRLPPRLCQFPATEVVVADDPLVGGVDYIWRIGEPTRRHILDHDLASDASVLRYCPTGVIAAVSTGADLLFDHGCCRRVEHEAISFEFADRTPIGRVPCSWNADDLLIFARYPGEDRDTLYAVSEYVGHPQEA